MFTYPRADTTHLPVHVHVHVHVCACACECEVHLNQLTPQSDLGTVFIIFGRECAKPVVIFNFNATIILYVIIIINMYYHEHI